MFFPGASQAKMIPTFEALREDIAAARIDQKAERIQFTVSMGCSDRPAESLDALISSADKLLYAAKVGGRNRLVSDTDTSAS